MEKSNGIRIAPASDLALIVILDFDDTLFPTSVVTMALKHLGALTLSETDSFVRYMTMLDRTAADTILALHALVKQTRHPKAPVYIISNATQGWIDESLSKWMPTTQALIKSPVCECISARDRFEARAPNQYVTWKFQCFQNLLSNYDPLLQQSNRLRIISIGDGDAEWEAARMAFGSAAVRVRMHRAPTVKSLVTQLSALSLVATTRELVEKVLFVHCNNVTLSETKLDNGACIPTVSNSTVLSNSSTDTPNGEE